MLYQPPLPRGSNVLEDFPEVRDITVEASVPGAPKRVYLAPEGEDISFEAGGGGRVSFCVPKLKMAQLVVIE